MPEQSNKQQVEEEFRNRRVVHIITASEIALGLINLLLMYRGSWDQVFALTIVMVIIFIAFLIVKNGKPASGIITLLSVLTLSITYFVWTYEGLRDEAIIGYPVILIYAFMLGNRKFGLGLLSFIIINILAIGYVNSAGIYTNITHPSTFGSSILISVILSIIGFSMWILSNDLSKLVSQLKEENEKAFESKEQIKQLLHHDALTNLPNRILAKDRFEQAVAHSKRNNSMVCMMFVDLDNFKNINDSLGHSYGDSFLIHLANDLKKMLRATDCVSRLGGDEFLIILDEVKHRDEVIILAEKLLRTINLPRDIEGNSLAVTSSIGVALTPEDGVDFETISSNADMAMYKAKQAGKNNYYFYNKSINIDAKEKISLIADLQKALNEEQFYLVYQPKIDLKTQSVIGAEALIRWQHPKKGLIPPDKFIPLAESSGMIIDIGNWVLNQACKDCSYWLSHGLNDIPVAVNVSSLQFKRGNISTVVLDALEDNNLNGLLLELELTESLMVDDSGRLKKILQRLRKAGVRFSIDDFGTGYSNLGYLKNFEVETLKIDQSFISKVLESPKDQALVDAIINMAASLNMKTVAEGIETEEIMNFFSKHSCDIGQGYYWSKPVVLNEFMDFSIEHGLG